MCVCVCVWGGGVEEEGLFLALSINETLWSTMMMLDFGKPYHVYFVVIHEYADTEQEGEEKLVFLK